MTIEPERTGKKGIEELAALATNKDLELLQSLQTYRYLTSNQIQRLHFHEYTAYSSVRCANRILARLKEWRLVHCLPRRIGGVRSGSGATVWMLTSAGEKVLVQKSDIDARPKRRRTLGPSPALLTHTLAVAEVAIRLVGIHRAGKARLEQLVLEPECWRGYTGQSHKQVFLKPDLYVLTSVDAYEDHWFLEVDLATERPVRIVDKARQYLAYLKSRLEQKRLGLFPKVVWIVPDEKRRETLARYLSGEKDFPKAMFRVITMEELEQVISGDG